MLILVAAMLAAGGITAGALYTFGAFSTEIQAEPVDFAGTDPFTAPVGQGVVASAPASQGTASALTLPSKPPTLVSGDQVGLYGGTQNNAACDPTQLVTFLQQNPDKANAWATVLGISPTSIPDYVAGLTPVLLRADTAVTNHGFKNGRANPINSVLQAGTAVLVDGNGVPRVRCKCGNPLLEAKRFSRSSYVGDKWPSFDSGAITRVQPSAQPISNFQLVDVNTGMAYQLPAGSTIIAVPGTTPAPPETPAPTEPPPAAPPAAESQWQVLNGRSYSAPTTLVECQAVSCEGRDGTFEVTLTCSSSTSCTSQSGREYTFDGVAWNTTFQSSADAEFKCNDIGIPTTRFIRFTVDATGAISGTTEQRADAVPPACPDPFLLKWSFAAS